MRLLSPRIHGFVDYIAVVMFALAPTLFRFGGTPAITCYVIAGIYLVMTVFTAYPLGIVKAIPFTVHGGIEAATAILLAALPWLMRFDGVMAARNFFLVSAGALALVWIFTDYKAADYPYLHTPRRRHA